MDTNEQTGVTNQVESQTQPDSKFQIRKWEKVGAVAAVLLVLGYVTLAQNLKFWPFTVSVAPINTSTPALSETQDPFATFTNWRTYRNEKYGFEFSYPVLLKDYSFSEIDYMFTVGSLLSVQFVDFASSPSGEAEKNHALQKTKNELLFEKENIQKEGVLLTNGMKALIKNQAGDGLFRTATIFTPGNDKIWLVMQLDLSLGEVLYYIDQGIPIPESVFQSIENQRRIKIFDQILSTFKFIEPNFHIPEEAILKTNMVKLITDVQMLGTDLRNYYKLKNKYPPTLQAFLDDKSYNIERIVIMSKEQIARYSYVVSSDYKHFVLYINLTLSKDKIVKVNNMPVNTIKDSVLGISCSDPVIYCERD